MKTKKLFALVTILLLCSLLFVAKSFAKNYPPKKAAKIKVAYSYSELQKNVLYDFSSAKVRKLYYSRLDQLADLVIEKKYAVALRGYADSIGTYKGNWVLSQKRADAAKAYLISKGVHEELIVTTPFGSTQPIASNKTAAGRQQNRRVEIKLKSVGD